ncbi:HAD-IA family hydrolase [Flagellimonas sp. HMM57]|uniref:HAD family hydrolase n=1 Tax=unclassified Flagellimonas TaxID=2644544 RepID=UPI0013CF8248|nr:MULTISPECIES: HAD-IA family hydrolase [unclassified Flagellimonas]UII76143.1 HAD-IA family hydrolase [Flagellimonas sp. HMM57]
MNIRIEKEDVIVFDLDDTLYNEIDFLKSAYLEIAAKLEPKESFFLYAQMFSLYRKSENVFDFLTKKYNITKGELVQKYRNHLPSIQLFSGADDVLLKIKENDGKLAIITDGRSLSQRNKIKQLGLEPLMDHIIISEEIGSEKPSELNYRKVEDFFKAKNYTYIGDNVNKDFVTPNKLGWNTVGLIDNGKNIHKSQDVLSRPAHFLPKHLFTSYTDINIIA